MILCHLHALNYHVWELTYIELIVYEKNTVFSYVCLCFLVKVENH